jgi:hypothetical protein
MIHRQLGGSIGVGTRLRVVKQIRVQVVEMLVDLMLPVFLVLKFKLILLDCALMGLFIVQERELVVLV